MSGISLQSIPTRLHYYQQNTYLDLDSDGTWLFFANIRFKRSHIAVVFGNSRSFSHHPTAAEFSPRLVCEIHSIWCYKNIIAKGSLF